MAAASAVLVGVGILGYSITAAAVTVTTTGTPGPYQFSTTQAKGQAGTCTYGDGVLSKITVVPPLAAERSFWTVPHNGIVTNGQYVHFYQTLYGLSGTTWKLLKQEHTEPLLHATLTRLPSLPAFTPTNGIVAGFSAYRVQEQLAWVNPVKGGIEGTATITLGSYWDGRAWIGNCHAAPAKIVIAPATATDVSVTANWKIPATGYFAGVVVCSASGTVAPTTRTSACKTLAKPAATLTVSAPALHTVAFAIWAYDIYKHFSARVAFSKTANALPGPVTNPQATFTAGIGVTLTWTNPSSPDFTGVKICRLVGSTPPSSSTCTQLANVANWDHPNNQYVDATAAPGTTYSYSLFAHDSHGHYVATLSPLASVTTNPGAISALTATTNADGSVQLSWTDPGDPNFTAVKICRVGGSTPTTDSSCTALTPDIATPTSAYLDSSAQPGTTYSYSLFAHDVTPLYSTAVSRTVNTIPDAIGGLTPTLNADGTVQLDWTYPSSPTDPDVINVKICRVSGTVATTDSTCAPWGTVGRATGTTFTDQIAQPGNTYSYSLWAYDGSYSAIQTVTVNTTPSTVTGLADDLSVAGHIGLSWNIPGDPNFSAVVICRADGNTPPSDPNACTPIFDAATPGTFDDTPLTSGNHYSYSVWNRDSFGTYSAAATLPDLIAP